MDSQRFRPLYKFGAHGRIGAPLRLRRDIAKRERVDAKMALLQESRGEVVDGEGLTEDDVDAFLGVGVRRCSVLCLCRLTVLVGR
jgi:hypothetical protein